MEQRVQTVPQMGQGGCFPSHVQGMFRALALDADLEDAMIDATIVRVHRSGQGAEGGPCAGPLGVPAQG